jgi:hypothetical protein
MQTLELTAAAFKWLSDTVNAIDDSSRLLGQIDIKIVKTDDLITVYDGDRLLATSKVSDTVEISMLLNPNLQHDIAENKLYLSKEYTFEVEHDTDGNNGRSGTMDYKCTISSTDAISDGDMLYYYYPNEEEAYKDMATLYNYGVQITQG